MAVYICGIPLEPIATPANLLISGAKSITGSPTGFTLITYLASRICTARKNIAPQIELFPMSQINDAIERLHSGQIRYRVVLKADFD